MDSTDFLAWWGAILSTLVAARQYWISRDRVGVELIHGVRDFTEGPAFVLRIKNFGTRSVVIEEIGIVWPWRAATLKEKLHNVIKYRQRWRLVGWCYGQLPVAAGPYDIPKLLDPGHALDIWVPFDAFDRQSDEHRNVIVGYARDALDRRYYSASFTLKRPPTGWKKKLKSSRKKQEK